MVFLRLQAQNIYDLSYVNTRQKRERTLSERWNMIRGEQILRPVMAKLIIRSSKAGKHVL